MGGVFLYSFDSRGMILAGAAAGSVNGLLGAGGGMVLVPLLAKLTDLEEQQIFPASVAVMLPVSAVSLSVIAFTEGIPLTAALPYLIGSVLGGILAGITARKIPVKWLHRGLGVLILWGGVRYLW